MVNAIFPGAFRVPSVTNIGMVAGSGVEAMDPSQNHRRAGEAEFDPEFLLVLAKAGDGAALGRLLEHYRNYIGLLIRLQGRRRLRKKWTRGSVPRNRSGDPPKDRNVRGSSNGVLDVGAADDRLILANQVRHSLGTKSP